MAKAKKSSDGKRVGYAFTVEGQYYGRDGRERTRKFYDPEVFYLPEVVSYVEGRKWDHVLNAEGKKVRVSVPNVKKANAVRVALYLIKNFYMPLRLKEKYEDSRGLHTAEITLTEKVNINAAKYQDIHTMKIKDMKESDLMQFVLLKDLNVELSGFSGLGDKKRAVAKAYKVKQDAKKHGVLKSDPDAKNLTEPGGLGVVDKFNEEIPDAPEDMPVTKVTEGNLNDPESQDLGDLNPEAEEGTEEEDAALEDMLN